MTWVVEIRLGLRSRQETPAAVHLVARLFPVHEPHTLAPHRDAIAGNARTASRCDPPKHVSRELEWLAHLTGPPAFSKDMDVVQRHDRTAGLEGHRGLHGQVGESLLF